MVREGFGLGRRAFGFVPEDFACAAVQRRLARGRCQLKPHPSATAAPRATSARARIPPPRRRRRGGEFARSGVEHNGVRLASSTGGQNGAGPASGVGGAASAGASSTGSGQVHADAFAFGGSGISALFPPTLGIEAPEALTTASAPGNGASALSNAAVGPGSSESLVAIAAGQAVSNAILTPSGPDIASARCPPPMADLARR